MNPPVEMLAPLQPCRCSLRFASQSPGPRPELNHVAWSILSRKDWPTLCLEVHKISIICVLPYPMYLKKTYVVPICTDLHRISDCTIVLTIIHLLGYPMTPPRRVQVTVLLHLSSSTLTSSTASKEVLPLCAFKCLTMPDCSDCSIFGEPKKDLKKTLLGLHVVRTSPTML